MKPHRHRQAIFVAFSVLLTVTAVRGQFASNVYGTGAEEDSENQQTNGESAAAASTEDYNDYNTVGEQATSATFEYATVAPLETDPDALQTNAAAAPVYAPVNPSETYAEETPHPFRPTVLATSQDEQVAASQEEVSAGYGGDSVVVDGADPDYSVRPLNVSAAIFEHIAPVHFYTQRWKIQAHVQLPDFSESLDAIDRYDELVRHVCDGFEHKRTANATKKGTAAGNKTDTVVVMSSELQTHCRNAEREVTLLTDRVRQTNEELRKVTTSTRRRRRVRRDAAPTKAAAAGAPPAAASAARQLFLAVEEVVNDRLFDRVELLEREAQWGFRLMKNELRVLRGTNQAVYKTVWKLTDTQKENDANIRRMVKKLRSLRSDVAREADETQARLTLVELVQLISLELTGMVEQQNEVLSLVTTSAAGRLHPMVMGVAELSRVYANVSHSMGLSEILVGDEEMPKMVRIRSAQDGRDVEVLIEVPMVKREEFQLYRAYALPRRLDGDAGGTSAATASAVVLESEYLAVNDADQTFVQLSEADLHACNTLGAPFDDEHVRFVCKLTAPLYTSGRDSCLISLFQQRPLEETPCEVQPVSRRDTVTKMRMPSTWLWLAANASTVRVRCANRAAGEEDEVLVAGQSIVQLNGMCELESQTFRLQAESTIFRNATVVQSKVMGSGSNIAAIDEFAMQQATQEPAFASHDLEQDPIRLSQPRRYHRWLNENGRAIQALTRNFRQVEAARKKEKQSLVDATDGTPDYMQVMLTVGQVAIRIVRLIVGLVTRFTGDGDDDFDFF